MTIWANCDTQIVKFCWALYISAVQVICINTPNISAVQVICINTPNISAVQVICINTPNISAVQVICINTPNISAVQVICINTPNTGPLIVQFKVQEFRKHCVGFVVLTTLLLKIQFFCNVTLLLSSSWRWRHCSPLKGQNYWYNNAATASHQSGLNI